MATSSAVNCDPRTVLCLHSCRCTGLGHVWFIDTQITKSNAELLHRSNRLEMALNTEAHHIVGTMIIFDMNGWSSLVIMLYYISWTATCRHQKHNDRFDDCSFLARLIFSYLLLFIVVRLDPPSFASKIDKESTQSRKDGFLQWIGYYPVSLLDENIRFSNACALLPQRLDICCPNPIHAVLTDRFGTSNDYRIWSISTVSWDWHSVLGLWFLWV